MGDVSAPGFFDTSGQQHLFEDFNGDDVLQFDPSPPMPAQTFLSNDAFGPNIQPQSNDGWSTGSNHATVPPQHGAKARVPQVWRNTTVSPKNGFLRNHARIPSTTKPIMKDFCDAATRLAGSETRLRQRFAEVVSRLSKLEREVENRLSRTEKRLAEIQEVVDKSVQANTEMMEFVQTATRELNALAPEALSTLAD